MDKNVKESLHTVQNKIEELVSREEIQEETYRILCNQIKHVHNICGASTKLNKSVLLLLNSTKEKLQISKGLNDSLKESIAAQKQIVTLCEYGNRKMLSIIRKHRPLNTRCLRSNSQLTFTFDQDEVNTMANYLSYWESREARITAHMLANS